MNHVKPIMPELEWRSLRMYELIDAISWANVEKKEPDSSYMRELRDHLSYWLMQKFPEADCDGDCDDCDNNDCDGRYVKKH